MNYIASITSQGQLTIPKPIRDFFGINGRATVHIAKKGKTIELKPYVPRDLLSLYGIMKDNSIVKANKGKSSQQIIDEENEAVQKAIANSVAKSMGLPLLT